MKKPLSTAIKSLYGIGDLGFSMMTSVELYLFVFFMTNVAKFSLPVVAIIGSVTSIVDACLSPIYGGIISGMKPMKWGRNRSWLIAAPPLVVILYMFQYTKIGPEPVAAAIVCAGFILSHIIWNIGWVANVSLIPLLANNPEERALLSSRRGTWTSLSGIFFSYIATPLAVFFGGVVGSAVAGYSVVAGLMAFLMLLGYLVIFKITKGYEETGAEAAATPAARVTFGDMLKSAFQNPHLLVLLLGDFFRYMTSFIMTAAAAYYFTYVAQNMKLMPLYLLLGAVTQVIGAFISSTLAKKLTTRTASIVSTFGLAISLIATKFVALNVTMFFVGVLIARLFMGILSSTNVALYSDVSVYSEWKTGKNAAPFVMGMMNLALKVAVVSRGTIIPIALSAAGFVAGADPKTASLALKTAVINVFLFIPGIFALVSALILLLGYRLTAEKLAGYQAEIDAKKSK